MPDGVPPRRAVLAGTVETAVNALWDAAPLVGDRITVVGAGMVGCCVAGVARPVPRRPGPAGRRRSAPGRSVAAALGVEFAPPEDADGGRDLVVHASATEAGLQRSLDLLAPEGTVVELSWYGDREVSAVAGRRVPLRPADASAAARSAPSRPPAGRAARIADRLALALDLLRDPAFDALITGESCFESCRTCSPDSRPAPCPRCAS